MITYKAQNNFYVSEFMEDLPDNVFFLKVLCGCGGSTLAITAKKNYVICMPFVSLIENKVNTKEGKEAGAFGFHGGISTKELEDYIASPYPEYKKILVTYDSLGKVVERLNPQDYKILIDEAHKLLDSASFRYKAVKSVMDNYEKFKSFVFMTATPVQDKYQLRKLKDIPKVTIDWGEIKPVHINKIKYNSDLESHVALLVQDYLDGTLEGTPYFFINSVNSILNVINKVRTLNKTWDNYRLFNIICAKTDVNESKIYSKLKEEWDISSASDPARKINFCTSTAFEGQDIFCEEGITYIVTDGRKEHTKYDILTTIPQIIGRIRDSRYKYLINLLYTESPYFTYQTPEEYSVLVKKELKDTEDMLHDYDIAAPKTKKLIEDSCQTDPYLIEEDGALKIAEWAWYNEMHNYEVVNTSYRVKLQQNPNIHSVPYHYSEIVDTKDISGIKKLRLGKTPLFKDLCKDYIELRKKQLKTKGDLKEIKVIENTYPCILKLYNGYGATKFKTLSYQKSKILNFLNFSEELSVEQNAIKALNLKIGCKYTNEEIRTRLEKYYKDFNIPKKVKATSIKDYYIVTKRYFEDSSGTKHNGYIIKGVK